MNHSSPLKVLYLNFSDGHHGAGIGAYRTFKAIEEYCPDVEISMLVCHKYTDDPGVYLIKKTVRALVLKFFESVFYRILLKLFFITDNKCLHSISLFPSISHREINHSDCDVILLHWIAESVISIESIAKINKPIVWKLADEWYFNGAEHYGHVSLVSTSKSKFQIDNRYATGYNVKASHESGLDINRWTWIRKRRCFNTSFQLVVTSNWMLSKAKRSVLAKNNQISVITNPFSKDEWIYQPKEFAKNELSLCSSELVISFGALGADSDTRKGFLALLNIFHELYQLCSANRFSKNIKIVIFGASDHQYLKDTLPFDVLSFGRIDSFRKLNCIYSASDIFICPSILESFGQTAAEAQMCGTPVMAFATGGFCDIIEDNKTGFLIPTYDISLFAQKLYSFLTDKVRLESSSTIRKTAVDKFSPLMVARLYEQAFRRALIHQL